MIKLEEVIENVEDTVKLDTLKRQIPSLCIKNISGWDVEENDIVVIQLLDGLSNILFKVSLKNDINNKCCVRTVLFRIYGEHCSFYYDKAKELEIFQILSNINIGPKLLSQGDGWRIEEWIDNSGSVKVEEFPHPAIFTEIASHIAKLHKTHNYCQFSFSSNESTSLERLTKWSYEASLLIPSLIEKELIENDLFELLLPEIKNMKEILTNGLNNNLIGWNIVFCHNDIQENNILKTANGLRLIDFEYADFSFQGVDIGNFFNEFTMDYTYDKYPYYKVNSDAYPSIELQRLFASAYLSEYLNRPVIYSEDYLLIDELLDSVFIFSQLSHLLWGLWSIIRSNQESLPFDCLGYGKFRFSQFFKNKIK